MSEMSYLQWLSRETKTVWWNDSGAPADITTALSHGAIGITTNPVLTAVALDTHRDIWSNEISTVIKNSDSSNKAIELTGLVVKKAAATMDSIYRKSQGELGYVCSQVNPSLAGNREAMLDLAVTMSTFAENVSVKLPATSAGIDVMEECVAKGINITITVSFTVPQVLATAEAYERGRKKAEQMGRTPGKCFAVVMIGRVDDYIRDIAHDTKADIDEKDIQAAGLAVVKRAYSIYKEKNYKAILMIAAMRGNYHITDLAGADFILSIHPKFQPDFLNDSMPKEKLIDKPVDPKSIEKLMRIPEFVRAYEPDGMKPDEFLSYGAVQRTATQFVESGWKKLESFKL